MDAESLVHEVELLVKDPSFSEDDILNNLNRGYRAIAGRLLLPWLEASATVVTSTEVYVPVPDDYGRNLFLASAANDAGVDPDRLLVLTGTNALIDEFGSLNNTDNAPVSAVCVSANDLYYQPVPVAPTDVFLRYYRDPDLLTSQSADIWSNDEFDEAMISFAAWKIMKSIEGNSPDKVNANSHHADYEVAMENLKLYCYRTGNNFVTQQASANKTW